MDSLKNEMRFEKGDTGQQFLGGKVEKVNVEISMKG